MKRLFAGKKKDKQPSDESIATNEPHVADSNTPQPASSVNSGPTFNSTASQPQQYTQSPAAGQLPYNVPSQSMPVALAIRPPPPTQVSNAIGWCCASPQFDFAYVLALADHLSSSSLASKEAARALRKEFKHATVDAQERAVRLTGILMRNTDVRFREQVASKKFLGELQDLCTSRKTDPRVADMILRVLSPLAYDYQRDADLSPITALYNKLKPPDWPTNGAPLDPEDPLLTPTADPRLNTQQQRLSRPKPPHRVPTTSEQLEDLRLEAEQAKGYAQMLSESLAYAGQDDDLYENELVMEFHAKCLSAQEHLSDNLQWATVQAEQSRQAAHDEAQSSEQSSAAEATIPSEALQQFDTVSDAPIPQLSSNNPFAPIVQGRQPMPAVPAPGANSGKGEETREERTLSVVLLAYSDLAEALSAFESHARTRRERQEVREVEERSRDETRFNRATAGMPDSNGDYIGQSTAPTPVRHTGAGLGGEGGGKGYLGAGLAAAAARGGSSGSRGSSVELSRDTPAAVEPSSRSPPRVNDYYSNKHSHDNTSSSSPPSIPYKSEGGRLASLGPGSTIVESRNPYAAYLASPSPPTSQPGPVQQMSASDGGFVIPDSFDAHRPLPQSLIQGNSNNSIEYVGTGHDALQSNEQHADYLDYAELHDEPPSPLRTDSNNGPMIANSYNDSRQLNNDRYDDEHQAAFAPPAPRRQATSDSDTSTILTPAEPSEKALGKMRRLSVREDTETDYDEQQHRLEEALRARYQRN